VGLGPSLDLTLQLSYQLVAAVQAIVQLK